MVRFSELVIENPRIKEIDINPLLVSPEHLIALDARVVLHEASMADADLPKPAIRPYPVQYVSPWKMKNGEEVVIRPIRPEDEPKIVEFHGKLSERTVLQRYFQPINFSQRTEHQRLTRICFIDYNREMSLVAELNGEIIAVGRLSKLHGVPEADLFALVADGFQGNGIGTELYRRLLQVARDSQVSTVHSHMLWENEQMQNICKLLGFAIGERTAEGIIPASLSLELAGGKQA
jgi:acetyltransferase